MSFLALLTADQKVLCKLVVAADTDLNFILDGEAKFLALANQHEIASTIAFYAAQHHGWGVVPTDWQQVYKVTEARITSYLAELDNISYRLAKHGISLVALKNAGIARGIHGCHGYSAMGDVDALVSRKNFPRAHSILLEQGFNFQFRSPLDEATLDSAELIGGAEYWKSLPDGEKMWFELQWRPIAGRWIRPDQEPGADELIARSVPMDGTKVRLLAPEDNLLQVALHTAKHSYVRAPGFRLHLDVDRIVNYCEIDWGLFLERVEALQVKTPVYFSLAIPAELFKTPIPEIVLDRLKPKRWKELLITRWLNKVGLFNPHEQKFSRVGYIVFTSLLYDDLKGFLRALVPESGWMRDRYGFKNILLLPIYHLRRWFDLAFRRVNT